MTSRETSRIISELSNAERIMLAQDLWDSIADVPEAWTLTAEQRKELNRRVKAYRNRNAKGETAGASWAQVKRRILARRK
jgi:putative addiction module component (TIGR02574 family)